MASQAPSTLIPFDVSYCSASIGNYQATYAEYQKLLTAVKGKSIEFYGDSITQGSALSNSAQRWSTQLVAMIATATSSTITEVNWATYGNQVFDLVSNAVPVNPTWNIYKHVAGNPVFINIGFNDVCNNQFADQLTDELLSCLESCTLRMCLPAANKLDASASNTTTTGTWTSNSPYLGNGQYSHTIGATMQNNASTVFGRYVGFSLLLEPNLFSTGPSVYVAQSFGLTITIDGVNVSTETNPALTYQNFWYSNNNKTYNGSPWEAVDFIWDTGSNSTTAHTISFTLAAYSTTTHSPTPSIVVSYFMGFNVAQANCDPIFLVGIETANWSAVAQQESGTTQVAGTEVRRNTWNAGLQQISRKLRGLGLPVYYVDVGHNGTYGVKLPDNIHPQNAGNTWIANRCMQVLYNGEYQYSVQ